MVGLLDRTEPSAQRAQLCGDECRSLRCSSNQAALSLSRRRSSSRCEIPLAPSNPDAAMQEYKRNPVGPNMRVMKRQGTMTSAWRSGVQSRDNASSTMARPMSKSKTR
eukprot:scaffold87448_cov37-Tisochrysis_lutea.AAC.2